MGCISDVAYRYARPQFHIVRNRLGFQIAFVGMWFRVFETGLLYLCEGAGAACLVYN